MISERIQIIIVVAMCFFAAAIVRLLALKKMDYKLGLAWMSVCAAIAVLSAEPRVLDCVSAFLGIASPVNMLFFFSFLFTTAILFSLSRRIAVLQSKLRRMAQEVAVARLQRTQSLSPGDGNHESPPSADALSKESLP